MEWKPIDSCYRAALPLNLPPQANFIYRSNNNMSPQNPGSPVTASCGFSGDYSSHDVVIVGNAATNEYILAGALTAHRSLTYFTVRSRCSRLTSILVEQPDIKEGEEPEQLMVKQGDDWRKLLREYAEASAAAMGVRPIDASRNLIGYCTWYYYYDSVSEANFLENVEALAAHSGSPYSRGVAQIDDGYQTFQGDWLDQDPSWPTPLEEIARQTTEKGLIPGIWLMPMVASTASKVFREHPDWFVQNDQGEPHVFAGWSPVPNNLWACIDATNPAVQEHLTKVFQTFWAWGFRYFKMDGLGFGLPQGRRHDPNATAVSAFRLAMKTIREAVPEGHLLGCCPPYMACLGYCDSCRVSGDTGRVWSDVKNDNCDESPGACNIKNAYHATMGNWWMIDRWFRADPDVLMTRQDNAWYTLGEARVSALTGILTGVAITSDNLGTIDPMRLALLDLAAKTRMQDVQPVSWEMYHWCQMWEGTINGKRAVAFVNDTDFDREFPLAEAGIEEGDEILQGLGIVKGALRIAAHDAALVCTC